MDGIASYIENKVCHGTVPYIKPIPNELNYWKRAKRMLSKRAYHYPKWFFGYGKLPRWIGYRLGYLLVDSFMKRQKNLSLAQLVRTKSLDVLRGAEDIYNLTLGLTPTTFSKVWGLTRKHPKRKIKA